MSKKMNGMVNKGIVNNNKRLSFSNVNYRHDIT